MQKNFKYLLLAYLPAIFIFNATGCGSDELAETQNLPAKAVITGGDRQAINNTSVSFDGSTSYDRDGIITNYAWDFGEGTKLDSALMKLTPEKRLPLMPLLPRVRAQCSFIVGILTTQRRKPPVFKQHMFLTVQRLMTVLIKLSWKSRMKLDERPAQKNGLRLNRCTKIKTKNKLLP